MKIWIYPQDGSSPSNYYELTNYIQDVNEQKRSDDAFAITTFKVMIPGTLFTNAKFNIPPFTIFEIATTNTQPMAVGNKRYFGKSKCIKYLRKQGTLTYYTHEITLIEPLAMLEAIQIGAKTFTNHTDKQYLDILSDIAFDESLIRVNFLGTWTQSEARAYSFDKGATMYYIANEIFRINNRKMTCKFNDVTEADVYDEIVLDVTPVDVGSVQNITINENALLLADYDQKQDDYCKCLESQVDNVIDRNTNTTYSDLTCRSDDNYCDNDNAYVELPVKVESIDTLRVRTGYTLVLEILISDQDGQRVYDDYGFNSMTWDQLTSTVLWLADFGVQVKQNHPNFDYASYHYQLVSTTETGIARIQAYGGTEVVSNTLIDISDKCLEESVYQTLTPQQQTEYCYYKSGDNKIRGVYKYYKDSLIYQALNITNEPMLLKLSTSLDFLEESEHVVYTDLQGVVYGYIQANYTITNSNVNEVTWDVKAHPICNQYVEDVKTDTPLNANSYGYHHISRSYGNSANFIDYDVMKRNIAISNKSLGTPELTLQFLNDCNLTANTKFTYDNKTWYCMSVIMDIFKSKIVYTVNATLNYDKQADCIGVKTQFEATKIALDNIKERHLYYRSDTALTLINNKTHYLYIEFSYDTNKANEIIVLPLNMFYSSGAGLTAVATMIDNYSAGKYIVKVTNSGVTKLLQKDASYVDENGEAKTIEDMKIISFDSLSLDDSRTLPFLPLAQYSELVTDLAIDQDIYKDEHEQLVFTIYLPNATLV